MSIEISTSTQTINFNKIFEEKKRILKSQKCLFFTLSLLFLLPLSVITAIYPALQSVISQQIDTYFQNGPPPSKIIIFVSIAIFVFSYFFSPCAIASITYAAFHGFNDEPIKFKVAIKSITASYFPLLATILLYQAIIFAATFVLFAFPVVVIASMNIVPLPYLIGFFSAVLIATIVYVQVNWCLVYVIVVIESKLGFEAFKRSKGLIKGDRWTSFHLILYFGTLSLLFWIGLKMWFSTTSTLGADQELRWNFLTLQLVNLLMNALFISLFQLYSLISTTVLYAYCKASHRCIEGALSVKYFRLPVTDVKVV